MDRRHRPPTCKVQGCNNLKHVYPNGTKAAYCTEHLKFRKGKLRGGQERMTGPMEMILNHLKASLVAGYPFTELPAGTDRRSVTALINRDWIVESRGLDGLRYKITGRGLKILDHYEGMLTRRDGICPRCGVRPRHQSVSGRRVAYCLQCDRETHKERLTNGGRRINPDRGCSRCGKPLLRYSTGRYSTYCPACERARLDAKNRRNKERDRLIAHGLLEVPLCRHCHQKPVRLFKNCVSDYCEDCGPKLVKFWKLRRILRRA